MNWDESSFEEACRKADVARGNGRANDGLAIKLTYFDECSATAPKRWLIKGVIASGETSCWIAPPGRGKSALHSDISVHLAAGMDWRGHRIEGTLWRRLFRLRAGRSREAALRRLR